MSPLRPLASAFLLTLASLGTAQQTAPSPSRITDEPVIEVGGQSFFSWQSYVHSPLFRELGLRCNFKSDPTASVFLGGSSSDCTFGNTNINPAYDPVTIIQIPMVFHVLRHANGVSGNVSMTRIRQSIDILNEDFLAMAGTNGANGTNTLIQFYLAYEDPMGNPTTGVTYTNNTNWYNDSGNYWSGLVWNSNVYCNVYTNLAGGNLGYVPNLPQGGIAGASNDRVVVLHSTVGRNAPIGPPYNQGRTLTHEIGHYLGLNHTFSGGCDTGSCYNDGDLICDTNDESAPNFNFCAVGSISTCGSVDPIDNYMDYSDDLCMRQFTPEQTNRMRCSLEHYRPNLGTPSIVTANFSAGPLTGTAPLAVNFNDLSNGVTTSWSWNFGNGDTSSAKNPTEVYTVPGTYTVQYSVVGPTGSDSITMTDLVVVDPPPVIADFTGSPLTGVEPLTVNFTDQSTGGATSWSWDFGDGGSSTAQNPSHTYAVAGTYSVELTATGPVGTDVHLETDYVVVDLAAPVSDFVGTPLSGPAPLTVNFTNLSTGVFTTTFWSFGDGLIATTVDASHTYNNPGTYNVQLSVIGPGGSDAEIKPAYVTVSSAPPPDRFVPAGPPTQTVTKDAPAPLVASGPSASPIDPPWLRVRRPRLASQGIELILGGEPGSVHVVLASAKATPSTGAIVALDLGDGFSDLHTVGSYVVPDSGRLRVRIPDPSWVLNGRTDEALYFQSVSLVPDGQPLASGLQALR